MKPTSKTGWWIVTYLVALLRPSEDPVLSIPDQVLRKQVMVRCEHWREAFNKARRIGIAEERPADNGGRWQFIGIHDLVPIPANFVDGIVLDALDLTNLCWTLEELDRRCIGDGSLEFGFDEIRGGQYYRAILDTESAGF